VSWILLSIRFTYSWPAITGLGLGLAIVPESTLCAETVIVNA